MTVFRTSEVGYQHRILNISIALVSERDTAFIKAFYCYGR